MNTAHAATPEITARPRVRMTRRGLFAAALGSMATAISGCSRDNTTAKQEYAAGEGVISQIPVDRRTPLPRITGTTLDGSQYDSGEHSGDIVVYNVWGSWCAPCRREAPVLRRVWRETRDLGVTFVGLNTRDNDAAARAFESRYRIEYPSITSEDTAGQLLRFGTVLPPSAVPSTVVVDRAGQVAARVIGEVSYGTLSGLVEDVLAEGTSTRRN